MHNINPTYLDLHLFSGYLTCNQQTMQTKRNKGLDTDFWEKVPPWPVCWEVLVSRVLFRQFLGPVYRPRPSMVDQGLKVSPTYLI